MTNTERIEFEKGFLDRLNGKTSLLRDLAGKREIIFQEFCEFFNHSQFKNIFPDIMNPELENLLKGFLSYGLIDDFLSDPNVEDIIIDSLSPIFIRKTSGGLIKTDKSFASKEELDLFIKKLLVFSERKDIKKINNFKLSGLKGRVNIVLAPFGPQITISRIKTKPLSIIELIQNGTLNAQMAAQFWLYVEGLGIKPANIIIVGGPGAGKTTLLNAIFSFIPNTERIVVIEDTLELHTDLGENCSRLESDEEVSLANLVKNALRMRLDRIIIGEVRGSEAKDMMTAMNIGKYCMATLHASSAREAIIRLENEPMHVSAALINMVDVFVVMHRRNADGKIQRVVGELAETGGMEQKMVLLSLLWSCDLSNFSFQKSQVSSIYRDRLAEISGKSPREIMAELDVRTKVINALLEKNIKDIESVTQIFHKYISNPQAVIRGLGLNAEGAG